MAAIYRWPAYRGVQCVCSVWKIPLGTFRIDRLMQGDRPSQVTVNTGSTVVYRPLLKVRGLSIEPCFSTMCIDLSIHVHVVKD